MGLNPIGVRAVLVEPISAEAEIGSRPHLGHGNVGGAREQRGSASRGASPFLKYGNGRTNSDTATTANAGRSAPVYNGHEITLAIALEPAGVMHRPHQAQKQMQVVKPYDGAALEALMSELESDRVVRKESFRGSAPQSVREAVCAFANNLAGHDEPGIVFIGVRDDGVAVGLEVTDELLRQLADIKADGNIVPPPSLLVEKRRLSGHDVAVVTVWPCDTPPARFKGRIHIRWGPRRGLASAQDERILNERRRHRDRPFDIQPVMAATLKDLDLLRFEQEYLPSLVAHDVLAANDRSLEQQLAATKLITGEGSATPTVLGLLGLGKSPADWLPGAYTQFLRFSGDDLSDPVMDEEVIHGSVADQIRRAEEKLEAHNLLGIQFADVALEVQAEAYPIAAVRQLVRNAFMHRSYEATNAPVRVCWFSDRIEIYSPGGPFGSVTPENFGEPGLTDYRNPNLAEALRALGFVQRFGSGIAIARKALGKRLGFRISPQFVIAVVSRDAP